MVAKSASFSHGSLVFVVCGWREEAMAGVFLRTYLVHTTYVFLYQSYGIPVLGEAHCTDVLRRDDSTGTVIFWITIPVLTSNVAMTVPVL
jgi:hypothetical protein